MVFYNPIMFLCVYTLFCLYLLDFKLVSCNILGKKLLFDFCKAFNFIDVDETGNPTWKNKRREKFSGYVSFFIPYCLLNSPRGYPYKVHDSKLQYSCGWFKSRSAYKCVCIKRLNELIMKLYFLCLLYLCFQVCRSFIEFRQ